mmetsp:Transcript_23768/g.47532  ORF Transcript_23768/g.47532 Transcript_23768/m.47532 type:complete len:314 (-) Transcript_23768:8-949(-)
MPSLATMNNREITSSIVHHLLSDSNHSLSMRKSTSVAEFASSHLIESAWNQIMRSTDRSLSSTASSMTTPSSSASSRETLSKFGIPASVIQASSARRGNRRVITIEMIVDGSSGNSCSCSSSRSSASSGNPPNPIIIPSRATTSPGTNAISPHATLASVLEPKAAWAGSTFGVPIFGGCCIVSNTIIIIRITHMVLQREGFGSSSRGAEGGISHGTSQCMVDFVSVDFGLDGIEDFILFVVVVDDVIFIIAIVIEFVVVVVWKFVSIFAVFVLWMVKVAAVVAVVVFIILTWLLVNGITVVCVVIAHVIIIRR